MTLDEQKLIVPAHFDRRRETSKSSRLRRRVGRAQQSFDSRAARSESTSLRKQYAGRNVEFVAVSLEGEDAPQNYLTQKGYGFHLKTNGDALLSRYQAVGVPWVVLTDAAGNAVANPSRGGAARELGDLVKIELDLRT